MNPGQKLDEYIEVLQKPTPQDPWDWRPGLECLSIRDVVNIFRSGLTANDLYQLSKSKRDREWIYNYAQMNLPTPAAETGILASIKALFGASTAGMLTKTPLYVMDKSVQVEKVEKPVS